ncbi:MAG: hypothetical protein RSE41_00405 [Clostridia bacterium]
METLTLLEANKLLSLYSNNKIVKSITKTKYNNIKLVLNDNVDLFIPSRDEFNYTVYMIRKSPYGKGNYTLNMRKAGSLYIYYKHGGFATLQQLIEYLDKHMTKQYYHKKTPIMSKGYNRILKNPI